MHRIGERHTQMPRLVQKSGTLGALILKKVAKLFPLLFCFLFS